VLQKAVDSGLAHTKEEALDRALHALRCHLPRHPKPDGETATTVRRLATFGRRHGLSRDTPVKELLRESRP
jgi:hypothetical protein